MPHFSIVIPTYNRESTLAETLASVAAQEFQDFECIVVDDGSQDRTCELAKQHSFVRLIRQPNSGPGSARNLGVASANGTYIAFLDSDDLWFPWTLKRYAEAIHANDRPAFITGKQLCFQAPEELQVVADQDLRAEVFADYFASSNRWLWYGVSSFVIRRDVFLSAGGFALGRINGEDAELAMRLGDAPGFVHVAEPLQFGYRQHDGNVTLLHDKSLAGVRMLLKGEAEGRFPGGRPRSQERAQIISRHVRPLALECARQGDLKNAMSLWRGVLRDSLRSRRGRFLLGLPALGLVSAVKRSLCEKKGNHRAETD